MDNTVPPIDRPQTGAGIFTSACRILCSVLIVSPLVYGISADEGDAFRFLILVLIASVAGGILVANSIFVLVRHRSPRSIAVSVVFVIVGVIGVLLAWIYLPDLAMH
ncbi:MAG: hypothetical protein HKN37_11845 [Rhodothermales bacterium]|nr:hypothetical protein [Rhodothermales bacterium]